MTQLAQNGEFQVAVAFALATAPPIARDRDGAADDGVEPRHVHEGYLLRPAVAARQWVWDRLVAEGVARFPFPPHGRIPNFAGAEVAAARLFNIEPWKSATAIKVNPDSPQRPLRAEALRRGITVFVPTPRLRGGFKKLDPRRIPHDRIDEAASLSRGDRWSEEVALADMPRLDAIVCGSVAVTRDGRRCGKGEGYSDLEFSILRELGHPPVPVATTVHDLQIVASVPRDPTDQPLSVIATPTHAIRIKRPSAAPTGIDWTRLSPEDLEEMPILAELKRMTTSKA